MAVETHCLLPVWGRGAVAVDPTETKRIRWHGDCVASLASTPHDGGAIGPAVYVVMPAKEAESAANATASSRKRARGQEEEEGEVVDNFIGAAKQRRVIDVHPAVLQHMQKLNAEVQRWRRYAAAADAAVARQLRAKDEEIGAARRLNWMLQEQLRAARVEVLAWRDAAAFSDAAAAGLRADLDVALRALATEDGESCCSCSSSNNNGEGEDGTTTGSSVAYGTCRRCGDGDAAVVFLPCRHLSACAPCAAVARACPACGLSKAGCVTINHV